MSRLRFFEIIHQSKHFFDKWLIKKRIAPYWLVVYLVFGAAVGYGLQRYDTVKTQPLQQVRKSGYKYVAPLLRCETPSTVNSTQVNDLSTALKKYSDEVLETSAIDNSSVYFRDLHTSHWFAINEQDTYAPASLLKVPLMMAVYKQAVDQPQILTRKTVFDGGSNNGLQHYPVSDEMKKGKTYTGHDLLRKMIINSDNTAKSMLLTNNVNHDFNQLFKDLKIDLDSELVNSITVSDYATIFRTLYSATYLDSEQSEKALELLTQTTFDLGLTVGVPEGIPVAHKFGETANEITGTKQLHDCGIVYHPQNPYILCVMTKGNAYDKLEHTIQTISKTTYDTVTQWQTN